MKIHIIGCSGSGKSYLADMLSKKHSIPHFDLDDIYWDDSSDGYTIKTNIDTRTRLLENILSNQNWIIEGVYHTWVEKSFSDADIIYVLDIPEYVYKRRIITRFIKRKLGFESGRKETFKSILNLLQWTNTFKKQNLIEIKEILQRYDKKVIWISDINIDIDKL